MAYKPKSNFGEGQPDPGSDFSVSATHDRGSRPLEFPRINPLQHAPIESRREHLLSSGSWSNL